MKLEDVTAEVRPRTAWEAVDLGFALARRHYLKLLAAWLLTAVPLWAALLAASPWIGIGWATFLIWWLKPLCDRVPLFILSRALFGANPRLGEVLRAWPRMLFRNLWGPLVVWRIGTTRSLVLAVSELEGLRGRARKERVRVLGTHTGGTASWLTVLCVGYEIILVVGLFFLGEMFLPDHVSDDYWTRLFDAGFSRGEVPATLEWAATLSWLAALTLVELFYVGGGFGLYLNCRTHLEGWDVELAFRRLARRLAGVAAAVLLMCAPVAFAQEPITIGNEKTRVAEEMKDVLKSEDFKIHTEKRTEPVPWNLGGGRVGALGGLGFLEQAGVVIFWLALAAAVAWLVMFIVKNRAALRLGTRGPAPPKPAGPRTLMGMDVTPESLPDDIAAAARERWLAGDLRGALGLLYRGSLSWLIHSAALPVRGSDTEGDCVRHARKLPEPERRDYFTHLTGHWVCAAYAGRNPPEDEMESLLRSWPFQRGGTA